MLYRPMKRSDRKLSNLGFGCMRLPVRSDGRVDEPEATRMLRHAIERGVNTVDTAWPYHNGGSELIVGRALQGGYREKVNLATKLPSWLVNTRADMDRYLGEQLKKLHTDRLDFYLVHGLKAEMWKKLVALGIREFLDAALRDGRIRFAGFSFHDRIESFAPIVDSYGWTFCLIQYNFMDEEYQAGTAGLRYAAGRGLDVMVMEPLRGGLLARKIPAALALWDKSKTKRSPAQWALRWVWDHPEVTVVLSGMSSMAQLEENLEIAEAGEPRSLSAEDHQLIGKVRSLFRERMKVPCSCCEYCLPCKNGVNIPECFNQFNLAFMYADLEHAKRLYEFFTKTGGQASLCQECGDCEKLCPQDIVVHEKLKDVAKLFGK